MKNIILFATLAITAIGCAQSKDKKVVPKVVKEVFQKNIQMKVEDIEKTVLKQNLKK
jgi:hydroxymethylpyrimidine/phosphomethylpyrimidine kinase